MSENFTTNLSKLNADSKSVIIANASASGQTPEQYLASRGGVNLVTGQYGDAYDPATSLTDAEYLAARAGGTDVLNAAILKKSGRSVTVATGVTGTNTASNNAIVANTADLVAAQNAKALADEKLAGRQSAYDVLYNEFNKYGLGSLVEGVKTLITDQSASPSQFAIALQNTQAYQTRFSANKDRISAGLTALSPAQYIALEDQYQNVMRNYGLPASYYTKDSTGKQAGFDKFIGGDVSAVELEDRIMTAQNRVLKANPEVGKALKDFYPDITNGDILAYALNPAQALTDIKRKVTAAEIGGAALGAGLGTNVTRAEELGSAGITKLQAQQGYTTIGSGLERGSQLASIYAQDPYTQTTAESEIFGLPGQANAKKDRQKITGLEKATFGAQTGISTGALARDRAGGY